VRTFLFAAAAAFALSAAGPALANGRFPASNQIVFSPADPNLVIARTTYGILPSHDNGATWSYLCEDALGLPPTAFYDPELGLTAGNALVAGVPQPYTGLDVSSDVGCSWSCVGGPLAGASIADNVVRPDAPHTVLVVTSTPVPSDAGFSLRDTRVFQSADDGATWTQLGTAVDSKVLVQTIDVSHADAQGHFTIYLSGTRGFGSMRTASVFSSTDQGQTWVEHPVTAFDPTTEDSIYIGGVDPTDAQRVYLRSSASVTGGQSRLFVSTDGGATFTTATTFTVPEAGPYAVTGEFLGFALSADGSKIYAGTKEDGLFVAQRSNMVFSKVSSIAVECLATRGQELWVCSDSATTCQDLGIQFVVGVTTDDGAHFTPKLQSISTICGALVCPAGSSTSRGCNATISGGQCQQSFTDWCQLNDLTGTCGTCSADAGAANSCFPDGGADGGPDSGGVPDGGDGGSPGGGASGGAKASSSCSCVVPGSGGSAGLAALGAFAALGVLARGRRRKQAE
jgi:hypothetical protein